MQRRGRLEAKDMETEMEWRDEQSLRIRIQCPQREDRVLDTEEQKPHSNQPGRSRAGLPNMETPANLYLVVQVIWLCVEECSMLLLAANLRVVIIILHYLRP